MVSFNNELGSTDYYLLANIFNLAKETTAAQHSSQIRIDPGLHMAALDAAAKSLPLISKNVLQNLHHSLNFRQSGLSQ